MQTLKLNSIIDTTITADVPLGVVADCNNLDSLGDNRTSLTDVSIHVSDLIKADSDNAFCPREYYLHFHTKHEFPPRKVTPGMDLIFYSGAAIHDKTVKTFINNSPFGKYVYGKWTCKCGHKKYVGYKPHGTDYVCPRCKTLADNYNELDVHNSVYGISAHPDLLILYRGVLYLYEIKTFDRKSLDFDVIESPFGDHKLQAGCYYKLLQEQGYKVYPGVRFIYVDRSSSKVFFGRPFKELEWFPEKSIEYTTVCRLLELAKETATGIRTKHIPPKCCKDAFCARAKNCAMVSLCFNMKG